MRIISWNINSLRLRMPLLKRLVDIRKPDVVCLQETKVRDEHFPLDAVKSLGFKHIYFKGEKGYNGVAILSLEPFSTMSQEYFGGVQDSRHVRVLFDKGIELHNFYIPAGGDEPDVEVNPKFKHKLNFVEDMHTWFSTERSRNDPIIILGDFNIAPLENDVWSHKQLLKVVSHTPDETSRLLSFQDSFDWVDVSRHFVDNKEKLFSWWSYRNRDWKKSNRGRRLDHIWVTKPLCNQLHNHEIIAEMRDWEKPSDHVPVVVDINI